MISPLPHLRNERLQHAHEQYRDSFVSHADFERMLGHKLPAEDDPLYKSGGFPPSDPISRHFHASDVIKYLRRKCASAPPLSPEDRAALKAARSGRRPWG
jgi:hypothetical protein